MKIIKISKQLAEEYIKEYRKVENTSKVTAEQKALELYCLMIIKDKNYSDLSWSEVEEFECYYYGFSSYRLQEAETYEGAIELLIKDSIEGWLNGTN